MVRLKELQSTLRLLTVKSPQMRQRAGHKNFVMSEVLSQLENYCERVVCRDPNPKRPAKVAVIGAGSPVGQIACLCLKMYSVVDVLAMYDERVEHRMLGAAADIAHIDTSCAVEGYQGRKYMKDALKDSALVLICGGCGVYPPCCNQHDREIFMHNLQHVRSAALACASFAPGALVVVQTPPVDPNFALVAGTLKKMRAYDPRKVFGLNAINAMRAQQLYAKAVKIDPTSARVPIICGTGRTTRVPVYSTTTHYHCASPSDYDCMLQLIREADDLICKVKGNGEQGHLSAGYAAARFCAACMHGIYESPTQVDSALVEQDDPGACYGMEYCSVPLTVGRHGIVKYDIPKLAPAELELLNDSKCDLEDMLGLGKCFAQGDIYTGPPLHCLPPPPQASGERCPSCGSISA